MIHSDDTRYDPFAELDYLHEEHERRVARIDFQRKVFCWIAILTGLLMLSVPFVQKLWR